MAFHFSYVQGSDGLDNTMGTGLDNTMGTGLDNTMGTGLDNTGPGLTTLWGWLVNNVAMLPGFSCIVAFEMSGGVA